MQRDPFLILRLDKDKANQNDVVEAYKTLKRRYSDDMLKEGDEGAEAAIKLRELEVAYEDCLEALQKQSTISDFGGEYGEISSLISKGNLDEAQRKLDDMSERNAEWHYLQSVIYYKKGWNLESRKQLQFAINMEPSNDKYKRALERLDEVINGPKEDKQSSTAGATWGPGGYNDGQGPRRSYMDPDRNVNMGTQSMCNCCSNLLCLDCCCECMGGDCIPCC